MATLPIELSQLLALDAELPTGYRTPFPDASSTHVIHQAIESLKGIRLLNTAQAKEIETLKNALAGANTVEVERTQTLQTLTQERTDSQILHQRASGVHHRRRRDEGENRLRQVEGSTSGAREGGWNLKLLADAIEGVAPADQEAIKKRREIWM